MYIVTENKQKIKLHKSEIEELLVVANENEKSFLILYTSPDSFK